VKDELDNIINSQYDKYCVSTDDIALLTRLKEQYTTDTDICNIGMEDFFVILRLINLRFDIREEKPMYDGFCWMFLDAIFNDGKIQKIASTVLPAYMKYITDILGTYDDIYTVNYDKTAEIIAGKKVHYLHGDFETLLDQYNPKTVIGYRHFEKGVKNPVIPATKHIYCNGLMGFSGIHKEKIMQTLAEGEFSIETIMDKYSHGMSIKDLKVLERLKSSTKEADQFAFEIINAKVYHPELTIHQYPMKQFRSLRGELFILGMSPNNDEHIWNAIINNKELTKITYYYHGCDSKKRLAALYPEPRINFSPDSDFWGA
jgi:hypothetical protein